MKAALFALGCKVNQYDTDALAQLLRQGGYEIVGFEEVADVYIIGSCTVTGTGDKKSRQMVHRAREKNPEAVICMAGCYPQTAKEEVAQLDVDLVLGTGNRSRLVELLSRARGEKVVLVQDHHEYEELSSGQQAERTRGYLKIQDGCDRYCSYCIIPYARGRSRSRNREAILTEAQALVRQGNQELVLTGIHLSSFGKDNGDSLLGLLEQLEQVSGLRRIRLGSLEPTLLTPEFVAGIARIGKLCPGFHVSLQSGCDRTLERMGRSYGAGEYAEFVQRLRTAFPGCGVMSDVMVGFPGESEADFLESLSFVESIAFSKVHLFPYSRRKGTPAFDMPGQIAKAEKANRAQRMAQVTQKQAREFHQSFIGQTLEVLFEQEIKEGLFAGYTGNYIRVFASSKQELQNRIVRCRLTRPQGEGLFAEVEE